MSVVQMSTRLPISCWVFYCISNVGMYFWVRCSYFFYLLSVLAASLIRRSWYRCRAQWPTVSSIAWSIAIEHLSLENSNERKENYLNATQNTMTSIRTINYTDLSSKQVKCLFLNCATRCFFWSNQKRWNFRLCVLCQLADIKLYLLYGNFNIWCHLNNDYKLHWKSTLSTLLSSQIFCSSVWFHWINRFIEVFAVESWTTFFYTSTELVWISTGHSRIVFHVSCRAPQLSCTWS